MQNIPIDSAQAGMVLAKDVRRIDQKQGPPVCGKGVQLTAPLIVRLQEMGITSVVVEGHPIWMEGDQTMEEMLASLERRFARSGNDPLMAKLKEIYQSHIRKSMGEPDGR